MPGNNDGSVQYELEVQRMIDEGGAVFQEYLAKDKTETKKDMKAKE